MKLSVGCIFRMLHYIPAQTEDESVGLSIYMHRVPYDMTFSAFLLAQLQTGEYDACFSWLVQQLSEKGMIHIFACINLMVLLSYLISYSVTQPLSELQEFYIQVPYSAKLFESRQDLLEIWSEFQGLSGQPYQISITGKPNQVILRFDFPTSRQMAQVIYKLHQIHLIYKNISEK